MSSHMKHTQIINDYSKVDKIQILKSVKEADIHMLPSPVRTEGDGMENAIDSKAESSKQLKSSLGNKLIYRPEDFNNFSFPPPPVITGKIVNLIPKHAIHHKKIRPMGNMKPREPKFVPYEPYKAAVKPIIPYEKSKSERKDKKSITDLSDMMRKISIVQVEEQLQNTAKDNSSLTILENEINNNSLHKEIKLLKEEKMQLEGQLKFQAQVNCDLKTLLVAAVGEDLETRVQHLTEDKLQLARALLSSAQVCTSHQERTEFLAGQCEVWRSKFLASSLMLEELASRKTSLNHHVTALENILRRLLDESSVVKEHIHNTFKCLCALRDNLAASDQLDIPPTVNILDIASSCECLSQALRSQLAGRQESQREVTKRVTETSTELEAKQLLGKGATLGQQDAASIAVMGAAIAVATRQTACCAHCSGEVHQV